jgi:hypothetical protein
LVFFFDRVVSGVIFDELLIGDEAALLIERFLGEADDLGAVFMVKGYLMKNEGCVEL